MTNTATLTSNTAKPEKQSWYAQYQAGQAQLADLRQEISMKRLQEINAKLDALQDKKNA